MSEEQVDAVEEAPQETPQEIPEPEAESLELNDVEDLAAERAVSETEEYAGDKPIDIFSSEAQSILSEIGVSGDSPEKFTREQIKSWPPEIRQVYQQMQQGVQKRFREQAEIRKSLQEKLSNLENRKIAVDSSARDQFKVFNDERLAQYLKKPDGKKPEAWDVDGRVKWEVQNSLSQMLGGYHEAMNSIGTEHQKQVEDQQALANLEQRKSQLREFIKSNADFKEYQNEIIEFRKEHPTFTPEKAYSFLKTQKANERKQTSRHQVEAALDASASRTHRAGRSGGSASPSNPPTGLSGAEIAKWFQRNPSAMKKHLDKLRGN